MMHNLQMILENVANNTKIIEVASATFSAKVFLESKSDRLNHISIPNPFPARVAKSE